MRIGSLRISLGQDIWQCGRGLGTARVGNIGAAYLLDTLYSHVPFQVLLSGITTKVVTARRGESFRVWREGEVRGSVRGLAAGASTGSGRREAIRFSASFCLSSKTAALIDCHFHFPEVLRKQRSSRLDGLDGFLTGGKSEILDCIFP